MTTKRNLVVYFLFALLAGRSAVAASPVGFSVLEITPQRYLFENPSQHISVVVSFDALDTDEASANSYLRSARFLQDAKNSRQPKAMGFESFESFQFQATREQQGSTWIGVLESSFKSGEKSALVSERTFFRNGWAFHVFITTVGNQTASSDSHRTIFNSFAPDLGLNQKVATVWDYLLTDAFALDEVGTNHGRKLKNNSGAQVTTEKPLVRCETSAAELGIDEKVVRHGTPVLHSQLSKGECLNGAVRVWDDIKQSSLDAVSATSRYGSKISNGYHRHRQYIQKQLNCRDDAQAPAPAAPTQVSSRALSLAQQQSYADWIRQSRIFQSAKAMVVQSACAVAGHVSAAALTIRDVDRDELKAAYSGVQAVSRGALAVGGAVGAAAVDVANHPEKLLYLSPAYDAALLAEKVHKFAKSGKDPAESTFAFLAEKLPGFSCLNDQEQTRIACKFVVKATLEIGLAVGTGGATSAVLRAARVGKALDEAILALETGTRAEQRAAAIRFAEAGASASARNSAAEKVIGRSLSSAEKDAVAAAHLEGKSGAGAYAKVELIAKTRILKDAGFSVAERAKLMRIGITGIPVDPAAIAAGAAAGNSTIAQPKQSFASDVLHSSPNARYSAAEYEKQAASYSKLYERDLARLDDPATSASDKVVEDLHRKASDVARLTMQSVSNADIATIEYVGDAGGKLTRMMQLASHAGSSTSDDAGRVMAKVISELPPENRANFISSLNNEFSAQNRILAGERPPPANGTYGRNLSTVVNTTYRNTVTEALGLHQPDDADKIATFFKRLDDSTKQKDALNELMATPQMRGVDVQEIKDLRVNAASAVAQHMRLVKTEEAVRKAEAERAALAALAKKDSEAAARAAAKAEQLRKYEGLKPTSVDLGRLDTGGR